MFKHFAKMHHDNRGMSLIELILVMAILSVVMLAVMSLYIPAQQSAYSQTQVSDIQGNLRLSTRVVTHDLLNAGFLEQDFPVVFPDATGGVTDPDDIGTENSADFVIRTRIVGNDFARVTAAVNSGASNVDITVSEADMTGNFGAGDKVRLFEPITTREVMEADDADPADRVYTVQSSSGTTVTIAKNGSLDGGDILAETVMVRIRDASQPPLQTIRYRLADGALQRIINGQTQFLTRNVDTANSSFAYDYTPEGRVSRVDVQLVSQTRAWNNNNDAISGAKSRGIHTTVKLRNVF